MILVVSRFMNTLITWKVFPSVQSLPKCFGIPMSLQKFVFLLGRLGGGMVLTSSQLKKRGFT